MERLEMMDKGERVGREDRFGGLKRRGLER